MATSDAITIGESWISEHYFTTDARKESFQSQVVARRKQWDEERELGTTRTRFSAKRAEILAILATLQTEDDRLPALYADTEHVLGFDRPGRVLATDGPVTRVSSIGIAGPAPLVIVHAKAVHSVEDLLAKDANTLLEPFELDEKTTLASVTRTLSTLFTSADHPDFALVLAGGIALIAERERWAEGRYLVIDLQLVAERNDDKKYGEIDRALTCLDAESLAPDADGAVWWTTPLTESIKHTVGVSADLREGVRLSIEIIANDVVVRRRLRGLPPLPQGDAQELARQSLRFLYRILFLLYAEASPELGVLPVGAPEYERGYSLDRLRDLTLVDLTNETSKQGTHLYESLNVLFRLVDEGHDNRSSGVAEHEGLAFRSLRADLFLPQATNLIDEVALGNESVQRVLRHLLLSKEKRGSDMGFISYAELGINQLGAVYEGLMSYTGFFADTALYEVAKAGDPSKGSWVVPVSRAEGIADADFVKVGDPITGEEKAVIHEAGTFVYRLAGRERQQSASYYTPEVLTRFVVSQALEELLDQDGQTTSAREILDLTVCEPALGSGAFAIEAGRQLAAEYLKRRQRELDQTIEPDEYPRELQKVKAYIALHQIYGVDLNATAVELAEVSLWLDTMVEGLQAPWFGLHLRRGNSLIGARRATYSRAQVTSKDWLKAVPADAPLTGLIESVGAAGTEPSVDGRVHHFLLPAEGWGSAAGATEAKLAGESLAALKQWRAAALGKPNKKQADALVDLARRVEVLWQFALKRLTIAESEIRRSIDVWGADDLPTGGAVTREQIEASLADVNGAYRRLRRVMDAWCALWFWPLTETATTVEVDGVSTVVAPPSLDQWIDGCQRLLGITTGRKPKVEGQTDIGDIDSWDLLETVEGNDLNFAAAKDVAATIDEHPWLRVCERVAVRQGFFHWELDFASVFARGGFDLQVGNPPWVRPQVKIDELMGELDPRFALDSDSRVFLTSLKNEILQDRSAADFVVKEAGAVVALGSFAGSAVAYPYSSGASPDLYRCFIELVWRHRARGGISGLVHYETHFVDDSAGPLRAACYRRLRRHFHFLNELRLFEMGHQKTFGVSIFGEDRETVSFLDMCYLYHPSTVTASLRHDGTGPEPGIKDDDSHWDTRPHRSRIREIDASAMQAWRELLGAEDVPLDHVRMVYTTTSSVMNVLTKTITDRRVADLNPGFTSGWQEPTDFDKGLVRVEWGPVDSWSTAILQGPSFYVGNPLYQSRNETMKNKHDWSRIDLESTPRDYLPVTSFKPGVAESRFEAEYPNWVTASSKSPRDCYRIFWRRMAANSGERTLIPAIFPPGATHVDSVNEIGFPADSTILPWVAGVLSSLLVDFRIRAVPKDDIRAKAIDRLPIPPDTLRSEIVGRVLRLQCLTMDYAELWQSHSDSMVSIAWTGGLAYMGRPDLGSTDETWTESAPLRREVDRRQAQLEIDVAVAISLGVGVEELCTVYRTQFPVLAKYDRNNLFDAVGRLVPTEVRTHWRAKGDQLEIEERTAVNQAGNSCIYELPFVTLDREADMRHAYAHFERILKERS